jgi:integrase
MGHPRRIEDGLWEVVVEAGVDPATGQRRRATRRVKGSKADAKRVLRRMETAVDGGTPPDATKLTVSQLLDRWQRDYVAVNTRPRTAESYAIYARHLTQQLGRVRIARLSRDDVKGLLERLRRSRLSSSTQRQIHGALVQVLKYAIEEGLLAVNVAANVRRPRANQARIDPPSPDAVLDILEVSRRYGLYPFVRFLVATGARRGEALGLRWRNVDLEAGTVAIVETLARVKGKGLVVERPKTKAGERRIQLDADTIAVLRAHRAAQNEQRLRLGSAYKDEGYVFAGATGGPLDPATASHRFETIREKAGHPKVRMHDLRHHHASVLLAANLHPKVVSARLGHATVGITLDRYSHLIPGYDQPAAEAFGDAMREAAKRRGSAR